MTEILLEDADATARLGAALAGSRLNSTVNTPTSSEAAMTR